MGNTKILGQVAAFIRSTTEPANTNVIWLDASSTPNIHKIYDGTSWVAVAGDSLGLIRVTNTDTPGYLADKIDDASLEIIDNKLKAKNSITDTEKARWNSNITTYFVDTIDVMEAIVEPQDGDEAFFPDTEDPSKMLGYKYDLIKSLWFKFSDQKWENLGSVTWGMISDADTEVVRVIGESIGFGDEGKVLSAKENGQRTFDVNSPSITEISVDNCNFINLKYTSTSQLNGFINIKSLSSEFPIGKIIYVYIEEDNTVYGDFGFVYNKETEKGFLDLDKSKRNISDSEKNTLYAKVGDLFCFEKFDNGVWRLISLFETQNTAYNKNFGKNVGDIVAIATNLANGKHVRLNSTGTGFESSNILIDRGDSPYDYSSELTLDATYRTLDLTSKFSGIIPNYASFVLLRVNISGTEGGYLCLRSYLGASGGGNESIIIIQNTSQSIAQDCWVKFTDYKIKYKGSSKINNLFITIGGWL